MTQPPTLFGPDGVSRINTGKVEKTGAAGFRLSSDFSIQTGRGMVRLRIPGTDLVIQMLPAEARLLGTMIVVESENAIMSAVCMRLLLEVGQCSPEQAVQIMTGIARGTRADHAMEFERQMQAARQEQAMTEEAPGGGEPS